MSLKEQFNKRIDENYDIMLTQHGEMRKHEVGSPPYLQAHERLHWAHGRILAYNAVLEEMERAL